MYILNHIYMDEGHRVIEPELIYDDSEVQNSVLNYIEENGEAPDALEFIDDYTGDMITVEINQDNQIDGYYI